MFTSLRPTIVSLLLIISVGCAVAPQGGRPPDPQTPLGEALAAEQRALAASLTSPEASDLTSIYERAASMPIWVDERGRLSTQGLAALALLQQAASEGLRPDDYGATELTALASTLTESPAASAIARVDVLLSAGVMRYCRHVHVGLVDPDTLGLQLSLPDDTHDFPQIVLTAVAGPGIADAVDHLAPPFSQYRALKTALTQYRALAALQLPAPAFSGTVHLGDPLPSVAPLTRLLIALGDLLVDTPVPASGSYDEVIAEGVARFQQRHGLQADGTIGRATAEALQVPLTWRVRQIELALERLRWLPDLSAGRLVVVNIPMFRLWALDAVPSSDPPVLDMGVIVGRALDTRTPVFAARMPFVVFRPYWNVPSSILRKEILPRIRRDPGYLDRERLELVRGQSDESPVVPPTAEHVAELARGTVRLRQRPGPQNSLGLIKFMFPNPNDVYLHGTPARDLFRHSRRDFSHGCIRVEDPVALAEWVLGRERGWGRSEILAAMDGAANRQVTLSEPVQVVIFYTTAAVMPGGGAVHFAEDLYGQDRLLDQAW